ncbi:MAG: tetratricopeptide repeat protein, partial [Prochlorothrix sp.]
MTIFSAFNLHGLRSLWVPPAIALSVFLPQSMAPLPAAWGQDLPASEVDPLTEEAREEFNSGNLSATLERLEATLEAAEAAGDWQQTGDTLNNIGLIQEQLGEPDQALQAYQAAIAAYGNLGSSSAEADRRNAQIGEAKTLNNLGAVYVTLAQPEAALGFLERSLVILREVTLPAEEAATLRNLGGIYASLNRFSDAIRALQQALELETELENIPAQLITQERLATLYTQVGALPEALRVLQAALPLAASVDPDLEGVLQSQIGEVLELGGDYEGAIAAYEASLAIVENSSQPQVAQAVLDLLTRLGALHQTLGQLEIGVERYQQVLERISSEDDPLLWGEVMMTLGQLYTQQQDWAAATQTYQEALGVVQPLNIPLAEAQLLRGLGTVYQSQEQFPQALDTLQQALALEQQVKNSDNINPQVQQQEEGLTLNLLGDVYRSQQQYDLALAQYQAAYTALQTAQDGFGQGETLRDMGLTHLLNNNPREAVEPLVASVQLWQFLSYQSGSFLEPILEVHQLLQTALIRAEQIELALASAEDERSFPLRLNQVWQSQLQVRPPAPLSIDQIKDLVAEQQKPLFFFDLASAPGIDPDNTVAKLRIWV